jgi:ElaB/YqjD/DUF883 family membrane-anchored ribosome-binding protein
MGKDASELRQEIDQTRDRMGETVDAIAYKTDVPSRVGDVVADRVNAVKSSITGSVGGLKDKVGDMVPDVSDVQDRARGAAGVIRENPLGLLLGAAAIGFLLGSLVPTTRIEEENLGPIGDQLKEQAQERIQETISTVKEATTQAVQDAVSQSVSGLTS